MMMLRAKQPNIQFEAFHVFKVFVANPVRARRRVRVAADQGWHARGWPHPRPAAQPAAVARAYSIARDSLATRAAAC